MYRFQDQLLLEKVILYVQLLVTVASDFFTGVEDVVVILPTVAKALFTVHAVGAGHAKFISCNGVTDCVVHVPVCASASEANGLTVSTAV